MAEDFYPLYSTAVIVPILAFPAWLLCLPPLYWHFSQRNIAAGSLILWMTMLNFFNSINPLIWPRDNILEWWNGYGFCDIEVHVKVCAVVALTSCTAVIARKLARVMDTNNITVAPSKKSRIKEKVFEVWWCWGFPLFLMSLYYIAQPSRYFIYAISGCVAAYDTSWPSIVVSWMWGPITTFVGSYYAGILIFRLFWYRREFHRLISSRNTTKSRFLRLFFMALLFLVLFLPYSIYILYVLARTVGDPYDWDTIHGPHWNVIVKIPTQGHVRFDIWAEIGSGYILFLLFGTGTDAHNTYKRMLCNLGLGKIFPSLYIIRESGYSTPSSVTFAKGFASNCASKAKSLFSKHDSVLETLPENSRNDSISLGTPTTERSGRFSHISTNEPILPQNARTSNKGLFSRMFNRRKVQHLRLPIFNSQPVEQISALGKSPVDSIPPGVHARVWVSDSPTTDRSQNENGVHIVRELHQAHYDRDVRKDRTDISDWA